MTSFSEQANSDTAWMIDEFGDTIVYHSQTGGDFEGKAVVVRNTTEPPPAGYEHILTQLHHEFTFMKTLLGEVVPKRDDTVTLFETDYTVHSVSKDDEPVWTVLAR
jgi:hypothetical protein